MNDFLRFFPSADFFQSAAMGQAGADLWSKWLMPTLDVKDIERRISELRTVQFWLEQNSKSLTLAIQTLEAQKMSLAALSAFHAAGSTPPASGNAAESNAAGAQPKEQNEPSTAPPSASSASGGAPALAPAFDAAQAWSDLSLQFSRIAAKAMGGLQSSIATAAPPEQTAVPAAKPSAKSKSKPKSENKKEG